MEHTVRRLEEAVVQWLCISTTEAVMYKTDWTRQTHRTPTRMSLVRGWITKSTRGGSLLSWCDVSRAT